jgi:hypothetical protein
MHVRVVALDLDEARRFLHAIEQMAGEAGRSRDMRVIVMALKLIGRSGARARALARAA